MFTAFPPSELHFSEDAMREKKAIGGKRATETLPIVHRLAAGIDVGARFHVVAVPPDICD